MTDKDNSCTGETYSFTNTLLRARHLLAGLKKFGFGLLLVATVAGVVTVASMATLISIQELPGISTPYRPQPSESTPNQEMYETSLGSVPRTGPKVPSGELNASGVEHWVIGYTNAERIARGIEPLVVNPELSTVARNYSRWMAKENKFTHFLKGTKLRTRWRELGYECEFGSENILLKKFTIGNTGEPERRIAHGMVKGWMFSPSHRRGILRSSMQVTGIGIYVEYSNKTEEYTIWATQHFCARGGQGSRFDRRYDGWEEAFVAPRVTHVDTEDYRQYDPSRFDETVTPTPAG